MRNRSSGLAMVIVALLLIIVAGPTIALAANALVPLVLAVGVVVIAARIVWYLTSRY